MEVFLPIAQVFINPVEILLLSAIVGVLSGLFGVGGGFLMTPFLIFMGVPPAYAVANEANNILATSVSGSTTHYLKNTLDYKMGFMIVIGGSIGTALGIYTFTYFKDIGKINTNPTIFLANEFFDAIPIKQFFKKKDGWFERFVNLNDPKKAEFKEEKIDIKKIEKHLNFEISKDQNIIEYSPDTFKYLKIICDLIQKNDGGMLVIDYGYADSKMHETLQAVNNHKYSNIFENIGESDITYNINFHSFEKFINQFKEINSIFTNQKKFLTNMGILQRAEIISKKITFSKKADLFYRVRRLIDEKQMGELFKVMLIKNKKNNFRTGFQN